MDTQLTPILSMLVSHMQTRPISFHVPGHKGRIGSYTEGQHSFAQLQDEDMLQWLEEVMRLDVTELSSTDDLHDPSGAIRKAQELAAMCFGAEETALLVGGSTSGNMALIIGTCMPGDLILVQRNVHKSVINGLILSGAKTVLISPERDSGSGLAVVPSLETVRRALALYPEAKAVFLTNPNYYGLSADLAPYAACIHNAGAVLLVDEAHGAHYGHHSAAPRSALQAGADGVVQSTHKTLSALTMGAMLHMQGNRLDRGGIKHALAMLQTSSPSFPVLASLDIARAKLSWYGENWFEPGLEAAEKIRTWIQYPQEQHSFRLLEHQIEPGRWQVDPLRIVLEDESGSLSGLQLQTELAARGCWAEMADHRYVVLVVGARTSLAEADGLIKALESIADGIRKERHGKNREAASKCESNEMAGREKRGFADQGPAISEPLILRRYRRNPLLEEQVELEEAVGRMAAERVVPYPPGIPLLYEGELIRPEAVAAIRQWIAAGARFQGMDENSIGKITVMAEATDPDV